MRTLLKIGVFIVLMSQPCRAQEIKKPILATGELPILSLCVKGPLNNLNPRDGFAFLVDKKKDAISSKDCQNQPKNAYSIGLKLRGFASAKYAKGQYSLSFQDQSRKKLSVNFFGMGKSHKWVLKGPFIDLSSMRDVLTYEIGREVGETRKVYFAPKTEYIWLTLNGVEQGLYVLTQKIEPSFDKVAIDTKLPKDASFLDDLKEYLLQVSFHTKIVAATKDPDLVQTRNAVDIEFTDPNAKTIRDHHSIKEKILSDVNELEDVLSPENIEKFPAIYRSKVDLDSLIDYMVMQEFSKNIDAYRRSLYFYKAKDGLFHFGPLWDFDLAYGNAWTNGLHNYHSARGWVFLDKQVGLGEAPWFRNILKNDEVARIKFISRYRYLRQPGMPLDWSVIESKIDKISSNIGKYGEKNFVMWVDKRSFKQKTFLSTKLSPDRFVSHVQILKNWIQKRLAWMDSQNEMDLF